MIYIPLKFYKIPKTLSLYHFCDRASKKLVIK